MKRPPGLLLSPTITTLQAIALGERIAKAARHIATEMPNHEPFEDWLKAFYVDLVPLVEVALHHRAEAAIELAGYLLDRYEGGEPCDRRLELDNAMEAALEAHFSKGRCTWIASLEVEMSEDAPKLGASPAFDFFSGRFEITPRRIVPALSRYTKKRLGMDAEILVDPHLYSSEEILAANRSGIFYALMSAHRGRGRLRQLTDSTIPGTPFPDITASTPELLSVRHLVFYVRLPVEVEESVMGNDFIEFDRPPVALAKAISKDLQSPLDEAFTPRVMTVGIGGTGLLQNARLQEKGRASSLRVGRN